MPQYHQRHTFPSPKHHFSVSFFKNKIQTRSMMKTNCHVSLVPIKLQKSPSHMFHVIDLWKMNLFFTFICSNFVRIRSPKTFTLQKLFCSQSLPVYKKQAEFQNKTASLMVRGVMGGGNYSVFINLFGFMIKADSEISFSKEKPIIGCNISNSFPFPSHFPS